MRKKIMILGAGIYQVPLIKKARELNLEVIIVSPKGKYPGIEFADIFIDMDTRNKEGILSEAKKLNIDAILTTGTDVATPSIGYVNDQLNLSGTNYKAACRSMDKILMKQCLMDSDVNTAIFYTVSSFDELKIASNKIGFPVIIKASDSSGSRGIKKAENEEELVEAWKNSIEVTNKDEIIVEKYLDGIEIGAQAVISDNKVIEVFIHSDETTPPPVCVPVGHAIPLDLPEDLEVKIKKLIKNAVKALGINNTISNIDLMIVGGEPYIIELAARMGATCLAENISIYGGFDAYELIIKLSLGLDILLPESYDKQANAAILLRSNKTGIVKSINIDKNVYLNENLINLSLDVKVGDSVNKFNVGPDRIGQIITIGDSETEALSLAYQIEKQIKIEIDEV